MRVLVVDYGMGNLRSVVRALEEVGSSPAVSEDPRSLKAADRVVLPGVGAFADGMRQLHRGGWTHALKEAALTEKVPMLGICLGMQLLADRGNEGEPCPGIGILPGEVHRLTPSAAGERIPHVGWNEVRIAGECPLFRGISDGSDFYFVHSYHLVPADPSSAVATTPYCGGFVSAAGGGVVFGVQFHPEKSSRAGFRLLENFLTI